MNKYVLGTLCIFLSSANNFIAMDNNTSPTSRPTTITIPLSTTCYLKLPSKQHIFGTKKGSLLVANPNDTKATTFSEDAHEKEIFALEKINDELFASSADDCTVKVWGLNNTTPQRMYHTVTRAATTLACRNNILAAGLGTTCPLRDKDLTCVYLWDTQKDTTKPLARYKDGRDNITAIAWCNDNSLITGSDTGAITRWDTRTKSIARKIATHKTAITQFLYTTPDNQVAIYDAEKIISQWDLRSGKESSISLIH